VWWLERQGILNLALVVFSAPMKNPGQEELIASGATQSATMQPRQWQKSQQQLESFAKLVSSEIHANNYRL
jgi:hypothetical protein